MKGKFSIKASSLPSPIVGTVVGTIDLTTPRIHKLPGNPPTDMADIRKIIPSPKIKIIYRVSNQKEILDIETLCQAWKTVAVTINSGNSNPTLITGIIINVGRATEKEGEWEDDFTIQEIAAG